ncbi:MAG: toxin-antitoxin system HicB family antitoxin [Actinobacteria bacterium]|nr:toxin-antitoxin system HicB family antitoxin [Actinomycetota bacterium]
MPAVKQMLLRIPEDLHRRMTAQAANAGRSLNRWATDVLDAAVSADEDDRRGRLRSEALRLGIDRWQTAPAVGRTRRRRILASTGGIGLVLDDLLADERDRV